MVWKERTMWMVIYRTMWIHINIFFVEHAINVDYAINVDVDVNLQMELFLMSPAFKTKIISLCQTVWNKHYLRKVVYAKMQLRAQHSHSFCWLLKSCYVWCFKEHAMSLKLELPANPQATITQKIPYLFCIHFLKKTIYSREDCVGCVCHLRLDWFTGIESNNYLKYF